MSFSNKPKEIVYDISGLVTKLDEAKLKYQIMNISALINNNQGANINFDCRILNNGVLTKISRVEKLSDYNDLDHNHTYNLYDISGIKIGFSFNPDLPIAKISKNFLDYFRTGTQVTKGGKKSKKSKKGIKKSKKAVKKFKKTLKK